MQHRMKAGPFIAGSALLIWMMIGTGCTVVEDVKPDGVQASLGMEYIVAEDGAVTAEPSVSLWYTYPDRHPESRGFLYFRGDTEVHHQPGNRRVLEEAVVSVGGMTLEFLDYDQTSDRARFGLPQGAVSTIRDGDDVELVVDAGENPVNGAGIVYLPDFTMLHLPEAGTVLSAGESLLVDRFQTDWSYTFEVDVLRPNGNWYTHGQGRYSQIFDGENYRWTFDLPSDLVSDSVRIVVHQSTDHAYANLTRSWAVAHPDE
ncbi:hypothetical protein KQI63_08625 [bacterium]|nr:hypothetical protein [bacterium]